jgi:putative hydrolase of the HAD superfamily
MAMDAVIFDWGGTLTPWHTIDLTSPWRAYAQIVAPGDPAPVAAALYAAERAAWSAVRDGHASSTFERVLAAAGVEYHEAATVAYRAAWDPHTITDPDVPALFQALRSRGLKVGVLSNTIWPRAWHESFFARDGVLELVDGGVYTSEIAYTKPHQEAFLAAMAAIGVDAPERCVFVGDRPYDDISGATAIGMRAVLVPHSDIPAEEKVSVDVRPDAVVNRLAEVLDHIDSWLGHRSATL